MAIHEDQTTELNTKIDEYKCEMTQMAVMNMLKEDIWNIDVGKLKVQLTAKEKSFNDLIKRLNVLKSEKESISARVNTLQQEKYSKDDLIPELETRLDSLQVVHAGVCLVIEDVETANNELMVKIVKMAELKGKVVGSEKLYQKEPQVKIPAFSANRRRNVSMRLLVLQFFVYIKLPPFHSLTILHIG
ncbi:protein Networked (NET), actin-binding (NAB) domain-containing protein [Artemisia annua]|uniref:Protein Networked (NET), actin-binding (NAB) domain-containing protein n=1 Tax=Artemisia annua TaxID=35608 RepID=A0A2U1P1R5_ARTAN|nr:protein Networked (NET), actin-binding (NAB) domain-containing protein [Artemisia annua]